MARKKRRAPARGRPRPQAQAAPRPAEPAAQAPAQQRRVGGDQALVRSVEMSLAPARQATKRGGRIVLEGGDPAIPLDRVPYFTHDLTQVAVVGGIMIALLVLCAVFVVPLFLH